MTSKLGMSRVSNYRCGANVKTFHCKVMYGKKMWFLSHPGEEPKFGPDTTSIRWLLDDFDHIAEDEVKPMICTLEPGKHIHTVN